MVQKPGPTTRERRQSDQCPPRGYRWLLHKRKRKETKQGERDRRKPKFPLKEHKGVRHQQHKRGHSPWCGAAERTSLPTREKGKERVGRGTGNTGQASQPDRETPRSAVHREAARQSKAARRRQTGRQTSQKSRATQRRANRRVGTLGGGGVGREDCLLRRSGENSPMAGCGQAVFIGLNLLRIRGGQ